LLSGAEGGRTPLVVTELTCLNDRIAEGAVLSTDSGGPKEPLLAGGRIFLWKGMDNLGGGHLSAHRKVENIRRVVDKRYSQHYSVGGRSDVDHFT